MYQENLSFQSSSSFSEELCCLGGTYVVPRRVVRRGFHSLASVHSPTAPEELRASFISEALCRFDSAFCNPRTSDDRKKIVRQLKCSTSGLCWNDERLLRAFNVQLSPQERIFFTVDVADSSTTMSKVVTLGMVIIILASILIWMASTTAAPQQAALYGTPGSRQDYLQDLDFACVCAFTLEFILRLCLVGSVRGELLKPRFIAELLGTEDARKLVPKPPARRIQDFLISPASVFDLLSILPFWLELALQGDKETVPWLRLCRMFRVSRVFKLSRILNSDLGSLSDANHIFASVLRQALPAFLMTTALVLVAIIVFSALIYSVERGNWYPVEVLEDEGLLVQFDARGYNASRGLFLRELTNGTFEVSPFSSIPEAAWWTLATITTVGYGDVVPITTAGKLVGAAAMLYGTLLLGLPIGIIGGQFSKEYLRMAQRTEQLKVRPRIQQSWGSPLSIGPTPGTRSSLHEHLPVQFGKLSPRARDRLRHAEQNLQEVFKLHGDLLEISAEQQNGWRAELLVTLSRPSHEKPRLERLGARILTVLSEAEQYRPGASSASLEARLAWHELCIAFSSLDIGPTLLTSPPGCRKKFISMPAAESIIRL